ncbi:hypothetical protein mRhiFer1_009458 [Rhinolophus ferrumequinum]|uniref:Uncharacterized protein n=1 Tax=Rhinolophus ferrumequinum TaxID=59479 RepID=A0A7J7RJ01_RHIFE|nr:hypothetical protein mRhiFer1_009458 [Rhinolophus ferrumequinum]
MASAIPARVKGTGEEGGPRPRLCLVDLAVAVQETHHCLVTQDTFHTGCGETPTRFARTSLSGKGKKQNVSVRSLSLVSSRSKLPHGPNASAVLGVVLRTSTQLPGSQLPQPAVGTASEPGAERAQSCFRGPRWITVPTPTSVARKESRRVRISREVTPLIRKVVAESIMETTANGDGASGGWAKADGVGWPISEPRTALGCRGGKDAAQGPGMEGPKDKKKGLQDGVTPAMCCTLLGEDSPFGDIQSWVFQPEQRKDNGARKAPTRVTECAFWWRRGSRRRFCEYLASEGQQLPVTESSEWPHNWWLNGMEGLQGRGWQGTQAGLGMGRACA